VTLVSIVAHSATTSAEKDTYLTNGNMNEQASLTLRLLQALYLSHWQQHVPAVSQGSQKTQLKMPLQTHKVFLEKAGQLQVRGVLTSHCVTRQTCNIYWLTGGDCVPASNEVAECVIRHT